MRAAVFRPDVSDAVIETMNLVDLRDDEVVVKLVASGICHTDVTCRDGIRPLPRPIILGHEGAGYVEKVGLSVTSVAVGDPVVLTYHSCGYCGSCKRDLPSYCEHFIPANFSGRRLDGTTALASEQGEVLTHFFGQSSFATHCVPNARNTIKVSQRAPLELLGPLGCGVQTGAGAVMNVMRTGKNDSLVIFGGGGVGLSALMAAIHLGCRKVVIVEPNAARRALALELGASDVVDPVAATDIVEELRALSGGGFNFAFDTCGVPSVIANATAALRNHGRMVLATTNAMDAQLSVPIIDVIARGLTICGVHMGDSDPMVFIPQLAELVADGAFPIAKLVKFYRFSDINQALQDQEHGRTVKPIILLEDDVQERLI